MLWPTACTGYGMRLAEFRSENVVESHDSLNKLQVRVGSDHSPASRKGEWFDHARVLYLIGDADNVVIQRAEFVSRLRNSGLPEQFAHAVLVSCRMR